jgi:hypothetical protein
MSDDGYLQNKLREQQSELNEIKNQLFEVKNSLRSEQKQQEELKQYFDLSMEENKKIIEEMKKIDIQKITTDIHKIIREYTIVQLKKAEQELSSTMIDCKTKLKNEYNISNDFITDKIEKITLDLQKQFFNIVISEALFELHDTLLKNGILKQPFNAQISYVNLVGDEELEITTDYGNRKVGFDRGKHLREKMMRMLKQDKIQHKPIMKRYKT